MDSTKREQLQKEHEAYRKEHEARTKEHRERYDADLREYLRLTKLASDIRKNNHFLAAESEEHLLIAGQIFRIL